MTQALALPTRKDEAWRYADIAAVSAAWPLPAPERIVVAAGEAFARTIVQDEGGIRQLAITLEAGARCDLHILNIGGDYGRVEIAVRLAEGAHFELAGAIIGGAEQTLEIVTSLDHAEPGATSNQIIRSVLGGKATGTYLGRIGVARDAQRTDAAQSVKAMLLSPTAVANAKPELEIFADDVKCAHGATVGALDEQALFYLKSRGIGEAEAKALLLEAFVAGLFEDIADDGARSDLEARARAALKRAL